MPSANCKACGQSSHVEGQGSWCCPGCGVVQEAPKVTPMGTAILRIQGPDGMVIRTVRSVPIAARPSPMMVSYDDVTALHLYRGGGLGDVLFLAAAGYALRQHYPHVDIVVHSNPRYCNIVNACTGIQWGDGTGGGMDLNLLVERSGQAASSDRVRIFCEHLGADYGEAKLVISLPAGDRAWGEEMLAHVPGRPCIIVPRTWAPSRTLTDAALDACCEAAVAAGYTPVLLCLEGGHAPKTAVDWTTRFDLDAAAALLHAASCVVSVDTGLLYLAAGLGTRSIGIYTNWPGHLRAPALDVEAIDPNIDCHPCWDPGGCHGQAGARCTETINWTEVFA